MSGKERVRLDALGRVKRGELTVVAAAELMGLSLRLQEYRGFELDSGGQDENGDNGHAGGHKQLSPVLKELLVETDVMADVPNMPNPDQLRAVLNDAAKGFSDKTNGAGLRMYVTGYRRRILAGARFRDIR